MDPNITDRVVLIISGEVMVYSKDMLLRYIFTPSILRWNTSCFSPSDWICTIGV